MLAFAANSLLARLALGQDFSDQPFIDPGNYSLIRLVSGAVILFLLASLQNGFKFSIVKAGNWISALALFTYAAAFSFSYVQIDAGLGALVLFACVQLTMIGWSAIKGEALNLQEIAGSVIALCALLWLVSPGLEAPPLNASILMIMSGIAWGIYSIRGKGNTSPLLETAGNFILTIPIALLLIRFENIHAYGIGLAIISGAITSGLGYALWYVVLPRLSTTKAAVSQLTVPVLAGIGGTLLLQEDWTLRFSIASAFILGGVALTIFARGKKTS